jgi:regulator of protease activity HflC (stomatin/prohibitin superfamily)
VAFVRDGAFVRLLGPGRHWLWAGFGKNLFLRYDVTAGVEQLPLDDVLPRDLAGSQVVVVGPHERLVRVVDGRVRDVLRVGTYRIWDVGELELVREDIRARPEPLAELDGLGDQVAGQITLEASAERPLVLLKDEAPVEVLRSGRFRAWFGGPWSLRPVDASLQELDIALQDLLTSDQVAVRVKPVASVRIADPLAFERSKNPLGQAYTAVQLALREVVGESTLAELLGERRALSSTLAERAAFHLAEVGFVFGQVGVKDVVLSAEVKAMLNQVTVARKESEALSIRRKEEVAQTRQLANTAKLLEANPVLLRLRELEAMKDLAGQVDHLTVVASPELMNGFKLR